MDLPSHAHLHHIKKENIGLIEVMGLAVLPARLKDEIQNLKRMPFRLSSDAGSSRDGETSGMV